MQHYKEYLKELEQRMIQEWDGPSLLKISQRQAERQPTLTNSENRIKERLSELSKEKLEKIIGDILFEYGLMLKAK